MSNKPVIHVVRIPHGWWEVRRHSGEVIARYASEFQAWDAGRAVAESSQADLVVHQLEGPPRYEPYDRHSQTLNTAGANMPRAVPRVGAEDRKPLILLVEDMLDARELYAEYLTYAGFSVITAINGHEALGLARLLRPDLILMDIRLPGMDGLEATADLKADAELAHIPVVAITADSSADIGERARSAGCASVIFKPVLPDEVATTISSVLATLQPQRSHS